MSLRREIHQAFDGIAPTTFGMTERVVHTVLTSNRRRRKEPMLIRLRAPLSLVAAVIAIALVAAVLVGGRIIQDWNVFRSGSPAGHAQLTQVQQLEARPLHLPALKSVTECTNGPFSPDGTAFGSGPLFAYGTAGPWTTWGDYFHNVFYTDRLVSGPMLVRARDIVNNIPVVFVGEYAAGPVIGTDTLSGARVTHQSELVLYANTASPVTDDPPLQPHAFEWGFIGGLPKFSSTASGWQIDGLNFSETFEVC